LKTANEKDTDGLAAMKYRKLRIAWSAGCGIVCVLLCVLWMRSYYVLDCFVRFNANRELVRVGSNSGTVYFVNMRNPVRPSFGKLSHGWHYDFLAPFAVDAPFEFTNAGELFVQVPIWLPVALFALAAYVPSMFWRFSLRTLLIAMTLVAAGFGLWAAFTSAKYFLQ
jgi:hypothetical protein